MDEPFGALDAITRDQLGLDLLHLWDAHKRTALLVTHSIPEAVFLSDRVIVMTPRPGRIESVVSVNLPRPRTLEMKETPEFNAAVAEIRRVFLAEGVLHD
jgi:NitT/TauT family transport system ATP-binding protein